MVTLHLMKSAIGRKEWQLILRAFFFFSADDDDSDEDDEAGEGDGQEKVSSLGFLCPLYLLLTMCLSFRRRKWGTYSWHGRCWRLLK